MIDKIACELAKLLNIEHEWRMELAFAELQNELINLRTDVAKSIACEKRVESSIERTQRQRMSHHTTDAESAQADCSSANLETLKEATALHRQILNEAEIQTQLFYTLKQWVLPLMSVIGPDPIFQEYSDHVRRVVNRLQRCRRPEQARTLQDVQELRRHLLEEQDARQALEELVIGKMRNAIRTYTNTESGLPPLDSLIADRDAVHSRLKVSKQQVLSWSHRAQMCAHQNNSELARAAVERQKLYERDCASIDAVLAVLQEAIFAISPDAPLD